MGDLEIEETKVLKLKSLKIEEMRVLTVIGIKDLVKYQPNLISLKLSIYLQTQIIVIALETNQSKKLPLI